MLKNLSDSRLRIVCALWLLAAAPLSLYGEENIHYDGTLLLETSSGDFAPYFMASNRYGVLTQSDNVLLNLGFHRDLDLERRFSWTYGARAVTGYSSAVSYERYLPANGGSWTTHEERPAAIWLQELWGGVKFRGVVLQAGMWQEGSSWLDNDLSSGDLIHSPNARPIPQVKLGFVDFQNIPFTKGWAQIGGYFTFGKFFQNGWLEDHYNYYNSLITTRELYCYREIFFRSNPEKPLSVTIGAQAATLFGGDTFKYLNGHMYEAVQNPKNLKAFWKAFLPTPNSGENFYEGQHLGSWDFMARYRLNSGDELKGYFQWHWEDGSGMAKRNGFDGLWGISYTRATPWWVDGAVLEYVDFTNQSGPVHFAPQFHEGSGITTEATGADNYYNNLMHNAFANHGMSLGTPMCMSPIYNRDGYPQFKYNKFRGVHLGVSGHLTEDLTYTMKFQWRRSTGSAFLPLRDPVHSTSFSLQGDWKVRRVPGLSTTLQLAMDKGKMPGDSYGALIGVSYEGLFTIPKDKKK